MVNPHCKVLTMTRVGVKPREPRCECCDLLVSACGKAKEREQKGDVLLARGRVLTYPGWFIAEYPGFCARCGEMFLAGMAIRRAHEYGNGYRAECCHD